MYPKLITGIPFPTLEKFQFRLWLRIRIKVIFSAVFQIQIKSFYKSSLLDFLMHFIQHCFICRPSLSIMLEDAGIEPRTVATSALAVRRSNHLARSHPHSLDLIHSSFLMLEVALLLRKLSSGMHSGSGSGSASAKITCPQHCFPLPTTKHNSLACNP